MLVKTKASIIEEFSRELVDSSGDFEDLPINSFRSYNDLGIPLCQALSYNLIESLTNEGERVIEETWIFFCTMFEVDPEKEYEDFDDIMIESVYGDDDDI
jgi:hypothetical protein